ncbi:MAG: hypothetical protein M3R08_11790, partial [Bacteroidota bacterium]|nr:hypothetical protein [Bacteroidota bacterium]
MFLEKDGITWVKLQEDAGDIMHDITELPIDQRQEILLSGHAWRMKFSGTGEPTITASDPATHTYNYFLGNDPTKWRSGVKLMGVVTYGNVWPGIDVVFKGTKNGNLKYDIVVHPGADPAVIGMSFEGIDGIRVSEQGELILPTSVGEVKELSPLAFYENNENEQVRSAFLLDNGILGFSIADHDPSRTLVIDPELIAATYSGAVSEDNYGHCATYDEEGNIYTGARSFGSGYPTTLGAFQANYGGGYVDMSLSKLNPDGSQLLWASYLGGSADDLPHSLIVNAQGELCVLGTTGSTDYPVTASAFQSASGGSTDMVVTVFSTDGTALTGSTYVAGSASDGYNGMTGNYGEAYRGEILVDGSDNILVASFTSSGDFPVTSGAYQTTLGGTQDAVVLSLNNSCSDLLWSTYLGGAQNDGAFGIRVIGSDVVVCGQTFSVDFPTTAGAYQTSLQGGQDGFVVRLNNNGSQLLASTYFGTSAADRPYFIDNDSNDDLWIYGQTQGVLPVQPADVFSEPNGTIFLAKFNPILSQLLVSTSFGESFSSAMTPVAFLVDNCDKIYVSGYYAVSGLPLTANSLASDGNFYLAAFDVDMSDLVFGTYYGGDHVDGGTSRFDKNGIVYQGVCATGNSMQTTPWAHATSQQISWDVGVFKIDFQVAGVTAAGAS